MILSSSGIAPVDKPRKILLFFMSIKQSFTTLKLVFSLATSIVAKPGQLPKAPSVIVLTLAGIVSSFKAVQPNKALLPIEVNPSGNEISVKFRHLSKADVVKAVSVVGSLIKISSLCASKPPKRVTV